MSVANTRYIIPGWQNQSILRLPETTDQGVDTIWAFNYHCLCLQFISVAHLLSVFVMILWASRWGMWVHSVSWGQWGMGVQAVPDAGLDTTWLVGSVNQIPPGLGDLPLFVPGVEGGEVRNRLCVADGLELTCWVRSAMLELFFNDKGWSSDFRLWTLQISLRDWNHYRQPVWKRVSQQGDEENSPKAH
jgi:hypothetical protein